MYLLGASFAETNAGNARNQTVKTKRNKQELEASRIRCAGKSVCLYRLRRAQVNVQHCLFRGAPRKAKRVLFTPAASASSMQRIQHATSHATSRRTSFEKDARRLSRGTGRRDLRRPSSHPASPRLSPQSGTRGTFATHPDAALPNPQRGKFLPAFSSCSAAQSRNSCLRRHELPSYRRLRTARRSREPLRQFAAGRRTDS